MGLLTTGLLTTGLLTTGLLTTGLLTTGSPITGSPITGSPITGPLIAGPFGKILPVRPRNHGAISVDSHVVTRDKVPPGSLISGHTPAANVPAAGALTSHVITLALPCPACYRYRLPARRFPLARRHFPHPAGQSWRHCAP